MTLGEAEPNPDRAELKSMDSGGDSKKAQEGSGTVPRGGRRHGGLRSTEKKKIKYQSGKSQVDEEWKAEKTREITETEVEQLLKEDGDVDRG